MERSHAVFGRGSRTDAVPKAAEDKLANNTNTLRLDTINVRPYPVENGDPLLDDGKLYHGPRIRDMETEMPNTIKKSSSNQALAKFRWGSDKRTTGRSKTGLQITVPRRETLPSLTTGPILVDKSILYTYASSSSGGGRTGRSFGSIGDHLSPDRSCNERLSLLLRTPRQIESLSHTPVEDRPFLQNLVDTSTPDAGLYKLLVMREVGPSQRPSTSTPIQPNKLPAPLRRRSLNDLLDLPSAVHVSAYDSKSSSVLLKHRLEKLALQYEAQEGASRSHARTPLYVGKSIFGDEPPVWARRGPPYRVGDRQGLAAIVDHAWRQADLDAPTFSLPFGVGCNKHTRSTLADEIISQRSS